MAFRTALSTVLVLCICVANCLCQRTLVLLGDSELERSHSLFLADLASAGLDLEVATVAHQQLRLQSWGTWLYENILILSSRHIQFGGALDVSYLVDFVDAGGNIFLATDASVPEPLRELAAELGADYLDRGANLEDHVSHSVEHGPASPLSSQLADLPAIIGSVPNPILYSGVGLTVSPDATLTMAPLLAEMTTVSAKGTATGHGIALVVTTQTRANARFLATGSLAMLSDEAFGARVTHAVTRKKSPTGNRQLAGALAQWTFRLRSVLRFDNFRHHRTGHPQPPPLNTYTIGDNITIEVDIFERAGAEWLPHASDHVQAEFVMLDPHIRKALSHDGAGHYSLTVKAPDVYGIFKWAVHYRAPGYSFVDFETVTPVRPLRHNEYPRFIVQAYPYYTALLTLSLAFFVMIGAVMLHDLRAPTGAKAK